MPATEELRRLLDERGMEYEAEDMQTNMQTYWGDWCFIEPLDAKPHTFGAQCELMCIPSTPEQAIAATLGAIDVGALQAKVKAQSDHINKLREEYKALDEQMERRCAEYRATIRNLKAELDAATSGSGKLTAEQVCEAIRKYAEDDSCYIFEVYGEMCGLIADELNATLGGGECRNLTGEANWFECSECGTEVSIEWCGSGYDVPRFCPNCGRRVKR